MNFLNRKMFSNGGGANQEYIIGTDKSINYYDPATFEQQLRSLPESEIFALQNSANSRQISLSPGLQSILNQVISGKQIPAFEDDPSVDTTYSSPLLGRDPVQNTQSYKSIFGDYGRVAKGIYGPVLSSLVRNVMPKEALDDSTYFGIPGIGGASLKSIAEYDSPFFGEGLKGFEETSARGGRTREELDAILREGLQPLPEQQIQDFQSEIDGFVGPTRPGVDVVDTAKVTEVSGPSGPTPITTSETLSIEGGPGSLEARRLAYEKEMIGRDEFGNLLPEGRLEQDDEIATLLDEIKPIEQKVDVDKTEADTLAENAAKFGGLSQDEFRATIDDAAIPKLPEIEMPIVGASIEQQEELRKQNDPISRKLDQPGFFGSDRFLNFIRNVGGELVRTGQFGTGLASGAAKAAEERAARELLADQEERKYQKEIELAKAKAAATNTPEIMKPEKILELNNQVSRDITDFQGGLSAVGFVDYAMDIIKEAQENKEAVGGFKGLMAKMVDKGFAFAGMGRDFDELSADSKVEALTKVVKQKNLQAILGESGRTISDKDRQIIETVFGNLSAFEDPSITLGKLLESRQRLAQSNFERYSNIMTNSSFLNRQGFEGQNFYVNLLPSLQKILGIDPMANQSEIARARFSGKIGGEGIPEIDL